MACAYWFRRLCRAYPDNLVSPGGVAMFAPVSRAAVHRALKEGRCPQCAAAYGDANHAAQRYAFDERRLYRRVAVTDGRSNEQVAPVAGRGNKSGQALGVRVSKTNHSLSAGIDAVDFAARPEILPRRRWPDSIGASASDESTKIVSQTGDISGHVEAFSGTMDGRNANGDKALSASKNGLKSHVSEGKMTSDKNSAGRIRTYNRSVNSRLLYH